MAEDGRASSAELYNIVSSRKFAAGLPSRIGRKLLALVKENLELFSDKQQRFLRSKECLLVASYSPEKAAAGGREAGEANSEGEGADAAARMEEMMARCRAFVREKAHTFDDRAAECAETERRARERARLDFEHSSLLAEDHRLHQRAREERELARRLALEEQERVAREAREREELERRLAWEAELARRRALEEELARRRRLEDEVDSSMMILERNRGAAPAQELRPKAFRAEPRGGAAGRQARGLSRSRSISSAGAKRSASTRSSRGRRSRKRGRSRGRRRRSSSSSSSSSSSRRRGRR
mmetsp:Transcript_89905/g.272847  ORF Transcript_89905/g.272847 Transcript_89905/m.272847 type:complete len:300 (+) Transcript_89905:367-1266(+)